MEAATLKISDTGAKRERQRHNAAYFAKLDEAEEQIKNGQTVTHTMDEMRAREK